MFHINRAGLAMRKQERPAGQEGRNCVLQNPRSSLLLEWHFGRTSTKCVETIKEIYRLLGRFEKTFTLGRVTGLTYHFYLVDVEKGNY